MLARILGSAEPRVDSALMELAQRNQRTALVAPVLLPLALVGGLGDELHSGWLTVWLAMMAVTAATGWVVYFTVARRAKAATDGARDWPRWRALHSAHVVVATLAWGGITLLFEPGQLVQNAVLLIVLLGVLSAAVQTIAVHSLAAYTFALICSLVIVFPMLGKGFGENAAMLKGMLFFYFLVMIHSARNANRTVLESIRLKVANEDLLAKTRQEADRADRANREKSMFLAAASHDLRQPVHALLMLVEALRQRTRDPAMLDVIQPMRQAGQAIGRLFSSLMELSRLESGAERVEPGTVRLAELVADEVERWALEAGARGLRLDLKTGRGCADATVHTDAVLLARVLDNLVGNAVRYTRQGRILVTLRLRPGGVAWLEVRDTGIGIAPQDLERVFEPYFQVANPERDRSKGLGLGLAIVRRTVALLGFELQVRSREGRGSCFRLVLPQVSLQPREAMAPGAAHEAPSARMAGARILVIDDDSMVRDAMEKLLGGWQAQVRCEAGLAPDTAASLQAAGWEPDCILCDYRLPGTQDGVAVLDTLTERFPAAVGILVTGELAESVRELGQDAGYLVLAKPVAPETLASTLASVLEARRLG